MTNRTKIIIAIVVIIAIIMGIIFIVKNVNVEKKDLGYNENLFKEFNEEKDGKEEQNEVIENNVIENNVIENKNEENNISSNIATNTQSNVTGKEEQESSNENVEVDNEKIAIELAQKEWGIDIDSYKFVAKSEGNGVYTVSVINKTTTSVITIYKVNVRTGAVTE